jgi:hypothetical protein
MTRSVADREQLAGRRGLHNFTGRRKDRKNLIGESPLPAFLLHLDLGVIGGSPLAVEVSDGMTPDRSTRMCSRGATNSSGSIVEASSSIVEHRHTDRTGARAWLDSSFLAGVDLRSTVDAAGSTIRLGAEPYAVRDT